MRARSRASLAAPLTGLAPRWALAAAREGPEHADAAGADAEDESDEAYRRRHVPYERKERRLWAAHCRALGTTCLARHGIRWPS